MTNPWCNADIASEHLASVQRELDEPTRLPVLQCWALAMDELLHRRPDRRPLRLVDAGCGAGLYGVLCQRWYPGSIVYHGYDISPFTVDAARGLGVAADVADIAECLRVHDCDAWLFAASLEYDADPMGTLAALLAAKRDDQAVILHRVRFHDAPGAFVPEASYAGQTIPLWRWNLAELTDALADYEYTQRAWDERRQSCYLIRERKPCKS